MRLEGGGQLIDFVDLTDDELLSVLKMRNHPEVRKWMYTQDEIQEEQHFQFVQKLVEDRTNQYLMVTQNENIIGVIYFNQIDFDKKVALFGLYANLFNQLKGAGRLLVEVSLFYAQNILKLRVLSLEVMTDNLRAITLYRKNGFVETGRIQNSSFEVLSMTKDL